jgi:hypothetical protein
MRVVFVRLFDRFISPATFYLWAGGCLLFERKTAKFFPLSFVFFMII